MLRLRPVSMSHRAARDVDLSATVALAMQHGRPCVSLGLQLRPIPRQVRALAAVVTVTRGSRS